MHRAAPGFLTTLLLFASSSSITAQTPEEQFKSAHKALLAHGDGFRHDGSAEAIAAIRTLRTASASFLVEQRVHNSGITTATLNRALCRLAWESEPPGAVQTTADEACDMDRSTGRIVELEPHLLLAAPFVGEMGTVYLLGDRSGKPEVVWSIDHAAPQVADSKGLLEAWRPENGAEDCRDKMRDKDWLRCGPLYASVGVLPPDATGNARFYVDAGYSSPMGASIAKQTSIWRWDGKEATLLWIDSYEYMIEQSEETRYDEQEGLLVIGQKGEMKNFYDCGSCVTRPIERRVAVLKLGVQDMGVRSLVPEFDQIDALLTRIIRKRSTAQLATSEVVTKLRRWLSLSEISDTNETNFGMVSASTAHWSGATGDICLSSDNFPASLKFRMKRMENGGYFITGVRNLRQDEECASSNYLPIPTGPQEASVGINPKTATSPH